MLLLQLAQACRVLLRSSPSKISSYSAFPRMCCIIKLPLFGAFLGDLPSSPHTFVHSYMSDSLPSPRRFHACIPLSKYLLHSALLTSPQLCPIKHPATRSLNCPRAGSSLSLCCTAIWSCTFFSQLMDRCLPKLFASSSACLVFSRVQGRCELPQQFLCGSPHLDGILGDTSVL